MAVIHIGDRCTLEYEWYRYQRKDSKPGRWLTKHYWYTPLSSCQICHKLSTPKKVCYRNDCYNEQWGTPILCTGCWNKVRFHINQLNELKELRNILKTLKKRNLHVQP